MEWKDITPYTRGDTVRKPTGWQLEDSSKQLRVSVVYGPLSAPNSWVFHCAALGFDTQDLDTVPKSVDASDLAKSEAIRYVLARLHWLSSAAVEMMRATNLANTRKPL